MSLSHRFSFRLFISFNFHLFTVSCTTGLDLLEEIISLVINQDKCRKSSTSIFQIASIPSSGYSTHSMLLILF